MSAILTLALIALVLVGRRVWHELRRFDEIKGDDTRGRSDGQDQWSFPFNKSYYL